MTSLRTIGICMLSICGAAGPSGVFSSTPGKRFASERTETILSCTAVMEAMCSSSFYYPTFAAAPNPAIPMTFSVPERIPLS